MSKVTQLKHSRAKSGDSEGQVRVKGPSFPTIVAGLPSAFPGVTGLGTGIWFYSLQDPGTRLQELASPICSVDLSTVETNMVTLKMDRLPPEVLCGRLQAVGADQVAQTSHVVRVLLFPWMGRSVCAMGHRDISAQDTKLALRKQEFVLRQLGP